MLILLHAVLHEGMKPGQTKEDWKVGCYKNYVRVNVDNLKCRKARRKDSQVLQVLHLYNDTFIDYIAYADEYYGIEQE